MTFGRVKSQIESTLIDSYKNEKEFKKTLREFKENVLKNQKFSKLYSIYDQLSSPQGLSEKDAEMFLSEGLDIISKLAPQVKLPFSKSDSKINNYSDIDNLVYTNKLDLKERVESRKRILSVLKQEKKSVNESIKIPVSSMVKIANQTLENYIQEMDTESKKLFMELAKTDKENLEKNYSDLKESAVKKLSNLMTNEKEEELKEKISETIEKLSQEKFTQINYLKLMTLEKSL
jgi:hypothetical protein